LDDLAAYNAKMLENMAELFEAQVESKAAGARKMTHHPMHDSLRAPQYL